MSYISKIIFIALSMGVLLSAEENDGFVQLFNGQTLEGWDGDPNFWRVEDGAIVGETSPSNPTKKNTFLIWQGGEVADFELVVEFKLRNHNSGIQYRSFPIEGRPWSVGGYQADIAEKSQWMGAAYGERYKGVLARRGEKTVVGEEKGSARVVASVGDAEELLESIDMDGWNEYRIIAKGNQVIQMINGRIVSEFSEDAGYLKSGLIALQLHSGDPMRVSFRNIKLREIKSDTSKSILFLAGKKSHGYNAHEHKAGCHLLARCLNESGLNVTAQVVTEGAWPEPWVGYDKPDSIVMYCDGLSRHIAKAHQEKIQSLVDQGVGVACLHFATEVVPEELGAQFFEWIGGYFEKGWSVNPHWDATFDSFPEHPISRGVQPFTIRDEWYYHMRFQPEMEGVTPILSSLPPLRTLTDRIKNKSRGSNPTVLAAVKAGEEQHVAWAYERPNGGRGFGFTGGHFHQNWRNDEFRKLVLNALVWTAKGSVPVEGVSSRTPTETDLKLNQDYPEPAEDK